MSEADQNPREPKNIRRRPIKLPPMQPIKDDYEDHPRIAAAEWERDHGGDPDEADYEADREPAAWLLRVSPR